MVASDGQRDQEERRLNQEWEELLEELRVVLPGTEVLFAFLLSLPFTSRFGQVANSDKTVYFIAFLAAAVATLLLMAPSAQHRLLWRRHQKNDQLLVATRLAIAGTLSLAVAVVSVVFLITNLLYDSALPAVITAGVIGMIAWLWYLQPLFMRLRDRSTDRPADGLSGEPHRAPR
jgi:O-antigen/teichoic acid export membrane protein